MSGAIDQPKRAGPPCFSGDAGCGAIVALGAAFVSGSACVFMPGI